jgi:hypothetical protein
VIILIALRTEILFIINAVNFGLIRRHNRAIAALMRSELLLPIGVDRKLNEVAWVDLLVMEEDILIDKHLQVLLAVVQVNRVKAIRRLLMLIFVLFLGAAVGFAHRDLAHEQHKIFLDAGVDLRVIPHVEGHSLLAYIESFLPHFVNEFL